MAEHAEACVRVCLEAIILCLSRISCQLEDALGEANEILTRQGVS